MSDPMNPADVRDAFVRAHINGEYDAPENANGYTSVRHGLAGVIPLVLAEERTRTIALIRAALAPSGAELHPDIAALCEHIADGAAFEGPPRQDPTPTTVFLAIGGEYDERGPVGVFAHRADAEAYGRGDSVQEWPVIRRPAETRPWITIDWVIKNPVVAAHAFDLVNPFPTHQSEEVRDFDGQPDSVEVAWTERWVGSGTWLVEFEGWDEQLLHAAWKERRDRIVAAEGMVLLPLDPPPAAAES